MNIMPTRQKFPTLVFRRPGTGTYFTIPSSIKRPHHLIPPNVAREVAPPAQRPARHLERRRMAPRLERELLLNRLREAFGPAFARVRARGLFDEGLGDQVRAAGCTCEYMRS